MKIGYQAPLPPAPTGVAAYASALLTHLKEHLVIAENAPLQLYQIGNNALHWEIYQRAIRQPGVILLHDACLHHLLLGQLNRQAYIEEFVYNYGEWFREPAARYWECRAGSAANPRYFARPMLLRLCEAARLVVVHNPAAAAAVKSHSPATPILVLPHLFDAAPEFSYREVDDYREQVLGVSRKECLFAVLGHLRESKRLQTVLSAVERLQAAGLPVKLLVQGNFVGPDLELALSRQLAAPWIVRRGYLGEHEWWLQAHAIDVAVNLRWPLAGESSGIATRLMGIGKPVVVTRSLETEALPEVAVVKVDPGLAEQEELEHFLSWLTIAKEARLAIGRHAAVHTREFHGVKRVAGILAGALARIEFSQDGLTQPQGGRYAEG